MRGSNRLLRMALRKRATPLNVIVSGSGQIDLHLPVFTSGRVQTLVVTTTAGAKCLLKRTAPRSLEIRAIPRGRGKIPASSILDAVGRMNAGKWILIEGGPRLLNDYLDEARHAADTEGALFRPVSNNRTSNLDDTLPPVWMSLDGECESLALLAYFRTTMLL